MKPGVPLCMARIIAIRLGLAGVMLLAVGCAERAQEPVEPSAAIALQVTGLWSAAYEAADAEALAALYAEDARLYRTYGVTLRGRSAIRDHLAADIGSDSAITLQVSETHGEGNVLFVQGEYDVTRADESELARGDFVHLWTRDGAAWQLVNDAWHERGVRLGERSGYELAERLFDEWTQLLTSGDLSALARLYAQDAMVVIEGREPVQDRTLVPDLWPAGGTGDAVGWAIDEVQAEGRLVFVTGRYQFEDGEGDDATASMRSGAYMQLWVRSGDQWRVHRETWPHGLPATAQ